MGYIYIVSFLCLITGFLFYKKTEEKVSFLKWLIISIVSMYAYNVTLCMILGIIHITQNMYLLSFINIVFAGIFLYKPLFKKEYQKYESIDYKKLIGFIAVLLIFSCLFVKDMYIFEGDVTHLAVDSAIHYRAAKHYSENMQLFVFLEDKTFLDFNIMQTGAYINDGIFMNVVNNITGLDKIYCYQIFETISVLICGISFYAIFMDKITTKRGLLSSICLIGLYLYGYPYNSWIYGFSYLTVGIFMCSLMVILIEELFSKDNVNSKILIPLIIMAGMGVTFSYCLFVPMMFSSACIYVFYKEFINKDIKKYLKFFGLKTLIITGLLLLVTIFGIGYLFIPSFIIEGQTNLVDAIQENGGIYGELYRNFIVYIPILVIFVFEMIEKIKNKNMKYFDVFSIFSIGFTALLYLGMRLGKVSPYYMIKSYFVLWTVILGIAINIVNDYIDKKILRIDVILLFILYLAAILVPFSVSDYLKRALILLLAFSCFTPFVKKYDLTKLKISPYMYILLWTSFVIIWVLLKSGQVLSEEKKHSLPNLVGMYYSENCEYRKALDLRFNFNKNNIALTKYARENLKDMTADNTILITELLGTYRTMWAINTLEYNSDVVDFRDIINDTNKYKFEDTLSLENVKYVIRLDSTDMVNIEECKSDLNKIKSQDYFEILMENENGYILRVK